MTTRILALGILAIGLATSPASSAQTAALDSALREQGYVAVPIRRGADRALYLDATIHGERLTLMLDFSNDNALFDIRALRKLDIAFEPTENTIPTPRKSVRIHKAEILGIEFEGKSTGRMTIYAGDVDAVYGIRPGSDGPDGVLGTSFLANLGAVMDFASMRLYLKLR